jgi:hypothetical protein
MVDGYTQIPIQTAPIIANLIGGIMVSELLSGQIKDFSIGICCFSAKHTILKSNIKDWLARNQNNVSKWSDMSTPWTVVSVNLAL